MDFARGRLAPVKSPAQRCNPMQHPRATSAQAFLETCSCSGVPGVPGVVLLFPHTEGAVANVLVSGYYVELQQCRENRR
eukprot:scaffold10564_cov86-Phaeocystis_antarctica.AAC.1